MKIQVDTDNVNIIEKSQIESGEYNVTNCEFLFSEEYENLTIEAVFTSDYKSYKVTIINNQCIIPIEVLENSSNVTLGVYAYEVENDELLLRYSPYPDKFFVYQGSYVEDAENSSKPTPTEIEQLQSQITNNTNAIENKIESSNIKEGNNISIETDENDVIISANFEVDTELDDSSTNPVENRVITENLTSVNQNIDDLENNLTNYSLIAETASKSNLSLNNANKLKIELKDKDDNIIHTSNEIDIPDVSNFITKSVDDLVNYYKKSETYTQSEVNGLIGSIQNFHYEIVQSLPQTGSNNVLYLLPKETSETNNYYDEYVYANNSWERIGSTEVDLTGYATETWVNNQISDFLTETQINALITNALLNYYTRTQTDNLLSNKLDKETGKGLSTNDYTTEEKNKLAGIEDGATATIVDDTLDDTSENPVQNKVIYESQEEQDEKISTLEDQIPNGEVEGTDITINDSSDMKIVDVQLLGNTEQDGTPTPESPIDIQIVTGECEVSFSNSDDSESETYTVDLGNIELCKIGEYQDYIYNNEESWHILQKLKLNTIDNNFTISYYDAPSSTLANQFSTAYFSISLKDKPISNTFISDKFIKTYTSADSIWGFSSDTDKSEGIFVDSASTTVRLRINKSRMANWADSLSAAEKVILLKQYLSENPINILYPLASAIDTEITDTTLINQLNQLLAAKTYKNITNIVSNGEDLSPIVKVFYKKYIDVDKEFDENSNNAIANSTVTKKFDDADWKLIKTVTLEEATKLPYIDLEGKYKEIMLVGKIQPTDSSETAPGELLFTINSTSNLGWMNTNSSLSNNSNYWTFILKLTALEDFVEGSYDYNTSGSAFSKLLPYRREISYDSSASYTKGYIESIMPWCWNGKIQTGSIFKVYARKKVND